MNDSTAWLQATPDIDAARLRDLAEALAERGIESAGPRHGGPGVVVFGAPGTAVQDLLHDSGAGRRRVAAACVAAQPLAADAHWRLLRAGAADVVEAGDVDTLAAALAPRLQRWCRIDAVLRSPLVARHLVGDSPAWRRALGEVVEAALFSQAHVLLLGESGTGKELAARLVHTLDEREPRRDLVLLDCSTLTGELAASEFFGHERGAYTGAHAARDGAFARADGGTLFLDEVGELPLALQPQLLRVVQEQVYKRVGGSRWEAARFRLVSATQRDLAAEVAGGQFRHDLYHRLAGCVVQLPPLHDRREDIVPLAEHFLAEVLPAGTPCTLPPALRDALLARDWPGNVRELRQLAQRIAARHAGCGPLSCGDLPPDAWPASARRAEDWRDDALLQAVRRALAQGAGLREISQQAAELAIRAALADEGGNLQRAARRLQVTDRALQMRRAVAAQPITTISPVVR